jgi:hypothetical protein
MYFDPTRSSTSAVPRWAQRLGLTLMAAATLGLAACGGGGGNDGAAAPPVAGNPTVVASATATAPPVVQSLSTDEATSVSVSSSATSTSTTTGTATTATMQVMRSAALNFDAKVAEGPSKDTQLKGKLTLNAKSTDGGKNFAVTGKLVQRSAEQEDDSGLGDADKAKIKAALKKFYDASKVDYEKFRLAVSALSQATDGLLKVQREAWRAVPINAPNAAAQYSAIEDKVKTILDNFGKEIDKLQMKLGTDLKALNTTLQADLQAIKPGSGNTAKPDVTVTGTLTAEGKISLTFDLGGGNKILGTGQSDAKGKYKGTFTGPASGDKGNWSANPILCDDDYQPTVPGTTTTGTVTMPPVTPTVPGSTPTGTTTVPPVTTTVPGTSTVPGTTTGTVTMPPVTTTVPGTGTTGTGTVTMPNPGPDNCTGRVSVGAEIFEVTSATVFKVAKGFSIGQYIDGIPFDPTGAKLVGGTAADIKVGRRVQVCSDDVISPLTASSPPPLKASTIVFK